MTQLQATKVHEVNELKYAFSNLHFSDCSSVRYFIRNAMLEMLLHYIRIRNATFIRNAMAQLQAKKVQEVNELKYAFTRVLLSFTHAFTQLNLQHKATYLINVTRTMIKTSNINLHLIEMKRLDCKQQIVLLFKKWMNLSTSILNHIIQL